MEKPSLTAKAFVGITIATSAISAIVTDIVNSGYTWFVPPKIPEVTAWISKIPPLTLALFTVVFLISLFYFFSCIHTLSALIKKFKEKKKNDTGTH